MERSNEAQPRKHDRASALVRRPARGQVDKVDRTAVRQKINHEERETKAANARFVCAEGS